MHMNFVKIKKITAVFTMFSNLTLVVFHSHLLSQLCQIKPGSIRPLTVAEWLVSKPLLRFTLTEFYTSLVLCWVKFS